MVFVDIYPIIETNGYEGWLLFLVFIGGLLVGGPFHNYFIEHFNRKKVCTLSYIGIALSIALFLLTEQIVPTFLALGCLGLSFGLATASSITITIDVTCPTNRDRGNVIYACMGRIGMIVGIPTAIIIFSHFGSQFVLYISLASIIMAWLLVKLTRHPFRAPLETSKMSWDRFILPKSWKIILMMTSISFILGAMLPDLIRLLTVFAHEDVTIQAKLVVIPSLVFVLAITMAVLEIYYLMRKRNLMFIALRVFILAFALYLLATSHNELSVMANLLVILILIESVFAIYKVCVADPRNNSYSRWDFETKYRLEVAIPIFSGLLFVLLAHVVFMGAKDSLEINALSPYVHLILLFGVGRISTPVFLLLILSARHCQRGTANTSHQLAWEIGIALGALITTAFNLDIKEILEVNLFAFTVCVLTFFYIVYRLSRLTQEQDCKE